MKISYSFYLTFFVISTALFLISGVDYSSGSPGGRTGSPGDGGNTCTQCHAGTAEPAEGLIVSDIPSQGFTPGETYQMQVSITENSAGLFGFEVTAEDDLDEKTGSFVITDGQNTQFVNGDAAVSHTSDGTTPDGSSKTWTMEWTAPEAPEGPVTFYAAVNAANGDGTNNGDQIFTSSESYQVNSVGIQETALVKNMYPNPIRDFLRVTLQTANQELRIWSANGKLQETVTVSGKHKTLDVSHYAEGVYFLSGVGHAAKKFMVRR
jgi:hypothetical protein